MKIMLVKKASGEGYSIEAGLADGKKHFDHHGKHSGNPCPARDNRIPVIGIDSVVEITHIDADTFLGLCRMMGYPKQTLKNFLNEELIEQIDLNGSSVCVDKFDSTLLFMVGIGQLARDLEFPFPKDEPQDVCRLILKMMEGYSIPEIIKIGEEATEKSETAYKNCKAVSEGKVGYWVIGASDPFDPSRPYEDGIPVVVVHRTHYKSISIYCDPKSEYAFGGKTVADIEFAGHSKAAGSPRGVEFDAEDGKRVYDALVIRVQNLDNYSMDLEVPPGHDDHPFDIYGGQR